MTIMTIAPLLTVILASSLLTWTAAQASMLCSWTKTLPTKEVHYSFLRSDPRLSSPSLRLYHSSWSGERALLGCAWSDDAAVIQNYLSLCRERTHEFTDHPQEMFDVDSMFVEEGLCVSVASPEVGGSGGRAGKRPARSVGGPPESHQGRGGRSEVRTHQRVKRGFIVPGTLWCGSGNKAPSYADLGVFSDTDSCCREHDQCKHTILSFHSEFGVFNSNIFTMSHCDCDKKFHSCLMEAKDSISDYVGYTFFNLLKMHCFEFSHRLQCTQRNWFGMCKETKMSLYAEVHPPTLYESPNPTENGSFINSTIPTEPLENVTSGPQLFSITAAASTVPTPSTNSPSSSITRVTNVTTSAVPNAPQGPTRPAPESGNGLEDTLPTRVLPELDADAAEKQPSCDVYKDFDKCRNKILPQQTRYGLQNQENTTMYHCNCTSRLFQSLAAHRGLTGVQALLLGRVSQSCFLLQDCTAGKICTAVVVKAELPVLNQRSGADMEEQRHLQAISMKVRRPNSIRAKRKDRAVRLHKLCLRMVRPELNKTRKHGQDVNQAAVRQGQLV